MAQPEHNAPKLLRNQLYFTPPPCGMKTGDCFRTTTFRANAWREVCSRIWAWHPQPLYLRLDVPLLQGNGAQTAAS